MSLEVKIDPKQFEEALKRHEENYEKELKEVDIRAVVLKTKKSLIEQARNNNTMYNSVIDLKYEVKSLNNKVATYENEISELNEKLDSAIDAFTKSTKLLVELNNERENNKKEKGFFAGLWDFIKCLLK